MSPPATDRLVGPADAYAYSILMAASSTWSVGFGLSPRQRAIRHGSGGTQPYQATVAKPSNGMSHHPLHDDETPPCTYTSTSSPLICSDEIEVDADDAVPERLKHGKMKR